MSPDRVEVAPSVRCGDNAVATYDLRASWPFKQQQVKNVMTKIAKMPG